MFVVVVILTRRCFQNTLQQILDRREKLASCRLIILAFGFCRGVKPDDGDIWYLEISRDTLLGKFRIE